MPFIESFSINTDRQHPFPFNIPGVKFARNIRLDSKVTIFVGDNGSGKSTRQTYGDDMQALSHGEAFLTILQTRIGDKGVFLLDEPEAALSPLKQLALLAFILEVLKKGNVQFLIATHSPILMGLPGAKLYEIKEDGMSDVEYKDTDHYRITKTFLDNPDHYLRHF